MRPSSCVSADAAVFGAKFAPYTGDRRLLSCAGDGQVRVFDLDRTAPETMRPSRREDRPWEEYGVGTACVRVFRCHRDRCVCGQVMERVLFVLARVQLAPRCLPLTANSVKRIAIEGSPDVFLTCSEARSGAISLD